jgi:hypothetical protein
MPIAATRHEYQSLTQLLIEVFVTRFVEKLDPNNGWVKLAGQILWFYIVGIYLKQIRNHTT